eukprot:GHVT01033709.1.p1 GENE.GHVT01033709.1~~GHVT01033709.1.p1  ORF type:complete len:384 (+),score=61.86 GHVT01033709.1:1612-2763(+)
MASSDLAEEEPRQPLAPVRTSTGGLTGFDSADSLAATSDMDSNISSQSQEVRRRRKTTVSAAGAVALPTSRSRSCSRATEQHSAAADYQRDSSSMSGSACWRGLSAASVDPPALGAPSVAPAGSVPSALPASHPPAVPATRPAKFRWCLSQGQRVWLLWLCGGIVGWHHLYLENPLRWIACLCTASFCPLGGMLWEAIHLPQYIREAARRSTTSTTTATTTATHSAPFPTASMPLRIASTIVGVLTTFWADILTGILLDAVKNLKNFQLGSMWHVAILLLCVVFGALVRATVAYCSAGAANGDGSRRWVATVAVAAALEGGSTTWSLVGRNRSRAVGSEGTDSSFPSTMALVLLRSSLTYAAASLKYAGAKRPALERPSFFLK